MVLCNVKLLISQPFSRHPVLVFSRWRQSERAIARGARSCHTNVWFCSLTCGYWQPYNDHIKARGVTAGPTSWSGLAGMGGRAAGSDGAWCDECRWLPCGRTAAFEIMRRVLGKCARSICAHYVIHSSFIHQYQYQYQYQHIFTYIDHTTIYATTYWCNARRCTHVQSDPWSILSATTQLANPISNSILLALWMRNSFLLSNSILGKPTDY